MKLSYFDTSLDLMKTAAAAAASQNDETLGLLRQAKACF